MRPGDEIIHLLNRYKGKWVALNKEENLILGVGNNAASAINEAHERSCGFPIVFKVVGQDEICRP